MIQKFNLGEIPTIMLGLTISQTAYQRMFAHFMKINGPVFVGTLFILVIILAIVNLGVCILKSNNIPMQPNSRNASHSSSPVSCLGN